MAYLIFTALNFIRMVRLFVLFVLLQSKVATIKPNFFASQLSPESVLIDVRTHEEFVVGHIEGAINIAVTSEDFSSIINQFPKKGPIYIYCRSGKRSTRAASQETGYSGGEGHCAKAKGGAENSTG